MSEIDSIVACHQSILGCFLAVVETLHSVLPCPWVPM